MKVHDGWQGGKFSAPPEAALRQLAAACSVFGMSEALHTQPPAHYDAHGDECKAFWDTRTWDASDADTLVIDTPPWKRGTDERSTVRLPWVNLTHLNTGRHYLRVVMHLPALHGTATQEAANTAALDGLAPALRRLIREQEPDGAHASGDMNRQAQTARGRQLLHDAYAPAGLRLIVPPKATHGLRAIIDVSGVWGADLTAVTMLRRVRRLDHRGYQLTGAFCPPLPSGALHEPEDTK